MLLRLMTKSVCFCQIVRRGSNSMSLTTMSTSIVAVVLKPRASTVRPKPQYPALTIE